MEDEMLSLISILPFSPTGSSEKIANLVAEQFNIKINCYDLSLQTPPKPSFTSGDMVIFSVPVFMGRVPELARRAINKIAGNQAKAVAIVVYGNRHYNDALIELCDLLKQQNFHVFGAAAFVAQHSIIGSIAEGRPDENDVVQILTFANELKEKIEHITDGDSLSVPGNRPYIELPSNRYPIVVTSSCIKCGLCSRRCPASAIPQNNYCYTDLELCIGCMRCIHQCPEKSRNFPELIITKLSAYMSQYSEPKPNEWYVI